MAIMDARQIEKIKDTIVSSVAPDKIILFGSCAKGTQSEQSDVDLAVIWETNMNSHQRNVFLSRLFPRRNFSLDIFAFTKKEMEKLKDVKGTILYEAFNNGKVIYG